MLLAVALLAVPASTPLAEYFRGRRPSTASPPKPWRPIGPAPATKPEVVAFYGEDAAVADHPEDTCTPSFWLDFLCWSARPFPRTQWGHQAL